MTMSPVACSGAMHCGVPSESPVWLAGGGVDVMALQQYCTAGAVLVTCEPCIATMLRDAALPSLRRVE
jgi:hypothetical protein